jgi:hypothetical protein
MSVSTVSNVVSMTITNPHGPLTISSVRLVWNKNNQLELNQAQLGSVVFWTGKDKNGSFTITPTSTLTLPGYGTTSTMVFTFNQAYSTYTAGSTTITINFSTPGCSSISKNQ